MRKTNRNTFCNINNSTILLSVQNRVLECRLPNQHFFYFFLSYSTTSDNKAKIRLIKLEKYVSRKLKVIRETFPFPFLRSENMKTQSSENQIVYQSLEKHLGRQKSLSWPLLIIRTCSFKAVHKIESTDLLFNHIEYLLLRLDPMIPPKEGGQVT